MNIPRLVFSLVLLLCTAPVAFAADTDGDGIPDDVELIEGRNANVKDNDVFGNARLFTMQQYRDFLSREGDAGGIQFYVNLLNAGTLVRGNVIENFFNSPEFQGVGSPVARLYFATFLRIPDYPGLIFQINAFRSGTPLAVIANNFTASPEFLATYGALNNTQFVTLLYTNILGRSASQGEIDFHVNRLVAGATRGEVLVGFSESPEYQGNTAHDVYVTMMYVGMLRRAPEQAGFDYWVAYMDAGNPGLALILGFLNAPEFHDRFLPAITIPVGGDLLLNEFLADPTAVSDANGEWVEVYNATAGILQLQGISVNVGATSCTVVNSTLLAPGAFFVFAKNGDINTNGGVPANLACPTLSLANNAGTITLKAGATVIDSFTYASTTSGTALSRDPDGGGLWCNATTTFGLGDKGSPGQANPQCP